MSNSVSLHLSLYSSQFYFSSTSTSTSTITLPHYSTFRVVSALSRSSTDPESCPVCDINYDPFLFMQDNGKSYGFVLTIYEYRETVASLWAETKSESKFPSSYFFPSSPPSPRLLSRLSARNGS